MWPRLMSAPIRVAGSSGSPTGQLSSSARIASTRSFTERWTMSRDPGRAVLAHVPEDRHRDVGGEPGEVRHVREHELRALAAELEQHALEVRLGAPGEEVAADLGRAREREAVDVRVAADRLAHRVAGPGDDVQDAVRDPGLRPELRDPEQAERRGRGRLDDDRVAGGERGARASRRPSAPGSSMG